MKKIILIIAIALTVVACKKSNKSSNQPDIYCVFYNQTCVGCPKRVFYKCASTKEEMQSACITLRDQGKQYEVFTKSDCSECK